MGVHCLLNFWFFSFAPRSSDQEVLGPGFRIQAFEISDFGFRGPRFFVRLVSVFVVRLVLLAPSMT